MNANDTSVGKPPATNIETYVPVAGIDPDFYIPAERDRITGKFARWLRHLPVFGR